MKFFNISDGTNNIACYAKTQKDATKVLECSLGELRRNTCGFTKEESIDGWGALPDDNKRFFRPNTFIPSDKEKYPWREKRYTLVRDKENRHIHWYE